MTKPKNKHIEIKLIEAATHIIMTKGLDHLNVRAVALKADCATGTLYNYFRDMNELILKINSQTLQKLANNLSEALEKSSRKQTLSSILAKEYYTFAQSNLPFWNLLFRYKVPEDRKLPKWYVDIVNHNFSILESTLKPHIDEKLIHKASRVLWCASHGIISLSLEGKLDITSKETAESLCESLFDNYLRGLKSP